MHMYGMHVMTVALVVVCARNWWLAYKYDRLRIAFRQRMQEHDAIVACLQDRDLQAPYMPRVPKVQTNKKKKKKHKAKQQSTAQ